MLTFNLAPEDEQIFVIYCHTNTVNGKKYVGQTGCRTPQTTPQQAIKERWGRTYVTCPLLYRAIKKHGAAAFTSEVLELAVGQAAANEAEPRQIVLHGTLAPNGYNLDLGGRCAPRHPETCLKISAGMFRRAERMTPEQRAAPRAAQLAAQTPEQRREIARKAKETMGPERLKAAARKREDAMAPGRKSEIIRSQWANRSPEERRAITHNGCAAASARTHEEHRASALKREAAKSPEARSAAAKKRDANRSPEERSERARNASNKHWAAVRAAKAKGDNDGL